MTVAISDPDFTLYLGDARDELGALEPDSVDCVVTSPPYFGLRDYGTGEWDGGDPACDHARPPTSMNQGFNERWGQGAGARKQERKSEGQYAGACERCGATRVDRQIGLEDGPVEYVDSIVEVFERIRTALAPHGTVWLNLGDSYTSKPRGTDAGWDKSRLTNPARVQKSQVASLRTNGQRHRGKDFGLEEKNLMMIPARVALALQEAGWYLRSEIIWSKPNAMPSSVSDRPTVDHEHVFMLTRKPRYYFDLEAIKEPAKGDVALRSPRTVWTIPLVPSSEEHFAAFPPELVRRAVLAGCPQRVCETCGRPSERIVEKLEPVLQADTWSKTGPAHYDIDAGEYVAAAGSSTLKHVVPTRTVGWTDCGHDAWRAGRVLDPFMGSGTTALVARAEGRHAVGVELSAVYAEIIRRRTSQLSILTTPA